MNGCTSSWNKERDAFMVFGKDEAKDKRLAKRNNERIANQRKELEKRSERTFQIMHTHKF